MDILRTLMQAINERWRIIPEDVGKAFIAQYGIKIPRGKRIICPDEVQSVASELGYPLVVKALAPDLIHKSDRGAVKVGVEKSSALQKATEELWNLFPGVPLLVEEMMAPGVELIIGLTNDDHFGPFLMIGAGGLFTDLFHDVGFFMLPAQREDAIRVLKGLKIYKLLTGYRGRRTYDIDQIVDAIMGLVQFGIEAMRYYESVDINPLLVNEHGITALDVKIILNSRFVDRSLKVSLHDTKYLDQFFYPQSVAVIGASSISGKPGHEVIRNILANNYTGKLYLVNPRGGGFVNPSV